MQSLAILSIAWLDFIFVDNPVHQHSYMMRARNVDLQNGWKLSFVKYKYKLNVVAFATS